MLWAAQTQLISTKINWKIHMRNWRQQAHKKAYQWYKLVGLLKYDKIGVL